MRERGNTCKGVIVTASCCCALAELTDGIVFPWQKICGRGGLVEGGEKGARGREGSNQRPGLHSHCLSNKLTQHAARISSV